jgi:hypothetical protein
MPRMSLSSPLIALCGLFVPYDAIDIPRRPYPPFQPPFEKLGLGAACSRYYSGSRAGDNVPEALTVTLAGEAGAEEAAPSNRAATYTVQTATSDPNASHILPARTRSRAIRFVA